MTGIEGKLFAVAHDVQAIGRDAERHQVRARRRGAPFAEGAIVFGRPTFVAVALDRDRPRGYLRSVVASASSAARAVALNSALSYSKKAGCKGDSRFRSSIDRDAIGSSGTLGVSIGESVTGTGVGAGGGGGTTSGCGIDVDGG